MYVIFILVYDLQIVKHLIEMKQKEISQCYPGLHFFKEGIQKIPVDSIPGLKLTGWKPGQNHGTKRTIEETLDPEQLYQALRSVLNQVFITITITITITQLFFEICWNVDDINLWLNLGAEPQFCLALFKTCWSSWSSWLLRPYQISNG